MSSRLTNSVRTPFKALRSRFPYLGTDFLKILIANTHYSKGKS